VIFHGLAQTRELEQVIPCVEKGDEQKGALKTEYKEDAIRNQLGPGNKSSYENEPMDPIRNRWTFQVALPQETQFVRYGEGYNPTIYEKIGDIILVVIDIEGTDKGGNT